MRQPRIIFRNSVFKKEYENLVAGDIVACPLNVSVHEEYIFTDLIQRGIRLIPSALSQLLSRSKCFQARVFKKWMVPETTVVTGRRDLVQALHHYQRLGISKVVTKLDRSDCGLGICYWQDVEQLYSHVIMNNKSVWPFVLQPFVKNAVDIRVVRLGTLYLEAYERRNSMGFRNNVHFGGEASGYQLSSQEETFCKDVMERGDFPYAHIDLLKTSDGRTFFCEISLYGGLKGAQLSQAKCNLIKKQIVDSLIQKALSEFCQAEKA